MCTGSHYIRHAHPFTALVPALLLIDEQRQRRPQRKIIFQKLTYRFSPLFKFFYTFCASTFFQGFLQ